MKKFLILLISMIFVSCANNSNILRQQENCFVDCKNILVSNEKIRNVYLDRFIEDNLIICGSHKTNHEKTICDILFNDIYYDSLKIRLEWEWRCWQICQKKDSGNTGETKCNVNSK